MSSDVTQPDPIRPHGMHLDEFRAAAHEAVDWIADFLESAGELPVSPQAEPGDWIRRLPDQAPEHGESPDALLKDFRELIVPGITHWNHPRFMAYFAISGSAPGILGEMLAAALNVNHMLWKTSPAATELEQVTLKWLRQWVGIPDAFTGIIHDTASTGTMHAILAARQRAHPETRQSGDSSRLVIYASEHAHSSVDKGALGIGIGLRHVRHVPSDAEFRMRPEELQRMIQEDRAAGLLPFCVIATIGTTSTASIDPVAEIAAIAEREKLWLHVDAAYAGPAAILPEYADLLKGATRADSIVVNPHKWMFTPVDLSALYFRDRAAMRAAVSLDDAPPYLTSDPLHQAQNLADYSLALGRRFRSLKLWFVMRSYGREGVARIIANHIALAQSLTHRIEADPRFELAAPQKFSLVCFRYRGTNAENQALLEAINRSGEVLLSNTALHGNFVLRAAIGNVATSESDIERLWTALLAALPGEPAKS